MPEKQQAPFGTWPSSLSAQLVAEGSTRIAEPLMADSRIFWLESIPEEQGRMSILCSDNGHIRNLLDGRFNVRSKVHEYGGGAYCYGNNSLFFCNASDQEIYRQPLTGNHTPQRVTLQPNMRFADLIWDDAHLRLICIAEIHSESSVDNVIVAINLSGEIHTLVQGEDFYAYPRLNHRNSQLCWISWSNPNMPWDSTALFVADVTSDGKLANIRQCQNEKAQSIVQPLWSPNDDLYYISDQDNWWNIYCLNRAELEKAPPFQARNIAPMPAEYATPLWVFRMQNYGFINQHELMASYTQNGLWYLCHIDTKTGAVHTLENTFASIENLCCDAENTYFIASQQDSFPAVMHFDTHKKLTTLSKRPTITQQTISPAEAITFPVSQGAEAHGFYYPAHNDQYSCAGPAPLIVLSHGGPTGQTTCGLNYKIQYWTHRGFSVVDVNYRGSTGYGRTFRQSLYGQWGVVDVEDVVAAAQFLVARGDADPEKLVIKGSSAGGYTTLAALTFTNTFNAGVSLYGIGDLELLANDTHKFEAHYLDHLIGPYPEKIHDYQKRSPIHHIDQLGCALLLFQGLEDQVVPPNQAQAMAKGVEEKGMPVALVEYPDEGHGFRSPTNLQHMLDAEYYFYQTVFSLGKPTHEKIIIKNKKEK